MTWPNYSEACIEAMVQLLRGGGTMSKYRANPKFPTWTGPAEDSYAWKAEREIEKKFGAKHAILCNSGTGALHAGLFALLDGKAPGAEVITSPYTFSATASSILLAGATPVFADVDPNTYCITPDTVRARITPRTAAILPVHLFGGLADIEGLRSFGLPVLEDACQAVGAQRDGSYSGTLGICGAYSFNGAKNCPAGEGGALVTGDDELARKARLLINHAENFGETFVGYNYRVNEPTALLIYYGLLELRDRNQQRARLANAISQTLWFDERLTGLPKIAENMVDSDPSHVFYCYPFTVRSDRPTFLERMKAQRISCGGGYITPTIAEYPAFYQYKTVQLPVADKLSKETLCLLYELTPDRDLIYVEQVVRAIKESLV